MEDRKIKRVLAGLKEDVEKLGEQEDEREEDEVQKKWRLSIVREAKGVMEDLGEIIKRIENIEYASGMVADELWKECFQEGDLDLGREDIMKLRDKFENLYICLF